MGGMPSVQWGLYDNIIRHVRISHAPRFVVDMDKKEEGFFEAINITYEEFAAKKPFEKMNRCSLTMLVNAYLQEKNYGG